MSVKSKTAHTKETSARMQSRTIRHKEEPFLWNESKHRMLAQRGKVLTSHWEMAIGAMVRGLPGSFLFVLKRPGRIAITNIFVFESLDILWLDARGHIVGITEHFRPWRLHTMNSVPAQYVVELPAGTVRETNTRIGDRCTCSQRHFS